MKNKNTVYLSQLAEVGGMWSGDVHALAEFLLRFSDARDREINAQSNGTMQRSLPTMNSARTGDDVIFFNNETARK